MNDEKYLREIIMAVSKRNKRDELYKLYKIIAYKKAKNCYNNLKLESIKVLALPHLKRNNSFANKEKSDTHYTFNGVLYCCYFIDDVRIEFITEDKTDEDETS